MPVWRVTSNNWGWHEPARETSKAFRPAELSLNSPLPPPVRSSKDDSTLLCAQTFPLEQAGISPLPENILVLVVCGGVVPLGGDPTVKITGDGLAEPPARAPECRVPP